jgi:signal transduction histidine kinase
VRPRTLRGRLVAASLGSILAALALFGLAASAITAQQLNASLDRALRQRARDVARLSVSAPAVLTAPGALDAPGGGREVVVEVLDGRHRIVARSLSLGARLLPHDRTVTRALAGRPGFEDLEIAGRPLRLYAAPLPDAGGPAAGGAVLVGSDTSDIERTLHRLRVLLAFAALGAALLAGAAAALLTRRGLRPLSRLSAAAREIERAPESGRRMPAAETDDELGALTDVLNGMLAALDRARDSERRFLADASHELRTPVTSLLGNVEYAARHGADAELLEELRHDAARLGRLVDDLLTLERQRAGPPLRRPVELDALVRAAVEAEPRLEAGRADPAVAEGDADALARALGNLVENALVHGSAPVSVSLAYAAGRATITVRDAGPGPSETDRERLFERFWRGGDATGRPGAGLGLPIAASIAEGHGGRITVDGAAFALELPASLRSPGGAAPAPPPREAPHRTR